MDRRPLTLTVLLALAGCAVGPDYVRPAVDAPATFKEAGRWKEANAVPAPVERAWWKAFGDPVLDALQQRVVVDNQNLRAAEAKVRIALAALQQADAALFPTLSSSASRTRASGGSNTSFSNANVSFQRGATTTYALSATANWEIDLWGRIRRGIESADANVAASADDLAAARLSTQALLAQTYAQLRVAEAQRDLLRRTATAYARFLELTRNRYAAGVASALDVAQAETQLANAETQATDAENQRVQLEHALAVLVGQAPANFELASGKPQLSVPAPPALLPSTLLENRPDIAAGERRVAAANAQIGVAKAAFFPVLNLNGSLGFRNDALGDLISTPNRFWSLGPALALTLFDGGLRSAQVKQAEANYDQTVANYRQTVLTAFQEVEDNLAAAQLLEQESRSQATALAAARRAREIAESQYAAGIVSALNVVTTQAAELAAEIAASNIQLRRTLAAVQLFKNAGGDWHGAVPAH